MNQLKCIIIDDSEVDRLTLVSIVKKFPLFNCLGVFDTVKAAISSIDMNEIDVVFLDIDMPEIDGITFRKSVMQIPICIFVTAHSEHALESFELSTLDYIIKPYNVERFNRTVKRIEEFTEIRRKALLFESSIGGNTIYIKEGHQQTKVKLHDIIYLEALKDYTIVVTANKRHCVLASIGNLLKENHFQSFVRVHKSYAVQLQYIDKKSSKEICLHNGVLIPVGRSYKENLNALL